MNSKDLDPCCSQALLTLNPNAVDDIYTGMVWTSAR